MLGRKFAKMSASTQAKSRAQGICVHVAILPWNHLQIQLTLTASICIREILYQRNPSTQFFFKSLQPILKKNTI